MEEKNWHCGLKEGRREKIFLYEKIDMTLNKQNFKWKNVYQKKVVNKLQFTTEFRKLQIV